MIKALVMTSADPSVSPTTDRITDFVFIRSSSVRSWLCFGKGEGHHARHISFTASVAFQRCSLFMAQYLGLVHYQPMISQRQTTTAF